MQGSVSPADLDIESVELRALDGARLGARLYHAAGAARGLVIVNAALGVPQRFYRHFAASLAGHGYTVLTYDYRGVGASRPRRLRGFDACMLDWARKDFGAVLAWSAERFAALPRVVVGHSFGGQALCLTEGAAALDAAILVASGSGYWRLYDAPRRWALAGLWYLVMPAVTSSAGYVPGWLGVGEDLPAGVASEWGRWCRHPHYLFGYVDEGDALARAFARPMLAFSFSDDWYAPRRAVEYLLSRFANADIEHAAIEARGGELGAVGHFGFFDPKAEALWERARRWLDEHLVRPDLDSRIPHP